MVMAISGAACSDAGAWLWLCFQLAVPAAGRMLHAACLESRGAQVDVATLAAQQL